jgi:diguanylate cyclase (GGDEF)-like protein/PAS domain S-box-containing protein
MPAKTPKPSAPTVPVEPDFRDLIDNAVAGSLIHVNFKPVYANEAFARLYELGHAKDVLKLPLIRPLIPHELWPREEADYHAMMRDGLQPPPARIRALTATGREIWVAQTKRVIPWNGSQAVHVTAYDVTAQMQAEQHLQLSEQRLRGVLEVLPYPVYIVRREDGQMLFVNRKTCLLFERSAGQLLRAKSVDFYVDPTDRDDIRTMLDALPDVRDIEVKMKTGTGRTFTGELAAIRMEFSGVPATLVAINDISQRKQLEAELFKQASTDALTGINNRRHFLALAEQEVRRSRRFERSLSAIMVDIDHFKPINDKFGHATGDAVIKAVVKICQDTLRNYDLIGRLGGEEFAIMLPETDAEGARIVAERVREKIHEAQIVADRSVVTCTISIGVAMLRDSDGTIDELLHRADMALYKAKQGGRNKVELAD